MHQLQYKVTQELLHIPSDVSPVNWQCVWFTVGWDVTDSRRRPILPITTSEAFQVGMQFRFFHLKWVCYLSETATVKVLSGTEVCLIFQNISENLRSVFPSTKNLLTTFSIDTTWRVAGSCICLYSWDWKWEKKDAPSVMCKYYLHFGFLKMLFKKTFCTATLNIQKLEPDSKVDPALS